MNNTTTKREATINAIIEYFKENNDLFTECIEELDGYNGYLGDDRYYEMEMLGEFYNGTEPTEILYRAFYGYDDDHKGAFNPTREFFKFNTYGNLVSTDYKDYSNFLDEYAVENMSENRRWVDSIDNDDELSALFDALEEDDEEDDAEE